LYNKHLYHFKEIKKIKSIFNIQPDFNNPRPHIGAETWKCGSRKTLLAQKCVSRKAGDADMWKRGSAEAIKR
jgi:hypothetical protein